MNTFRLAVALLASVACTMPLSAQAIRPIERRIPPRGKPLPADQKTELTRAVETLSAHLDKVRRAKHAADVDVFVKAVDLALRHDEFYGKNDVEKARWAIGEAEKRLKQLKAAPWTRQTGLVVRGYFSSIDGSAQPYGLVIPKALPRGRKVPLYVWLHGRGDKTTDLHFMQQRATKTGEIQTDDAIVLHPFGRHCVGWKHAGEIDVLDAIADVAAQYPIDLDRVVLMGFSMGGAGAWHVGAHYTDRFAGIHAGAGFAETARYIRLKKEDYPAGYEQTLWGVYDVPNYVRNLFNRPVLAYSGEKDKQIQAARVMEEAFQAHDRKLTHIIGPGMGHKYHPESLKQVLQFAAQAAKTGRPDSPREVHLQTRTLRYHKMDWVEITGLEEHWRDARVDAALDGRAVEIKTKNVSGLKLHLPRVKSVTIDGTSLSGSEFRKHNGRWLADELPEANRKRHGLQGPIDDAFMSPFLVVLPSGKSDHAKVQRWLDFEIEHFKSRWAALFRGDLRVKPDTEVTADDIENYNLICWGDATTNAVIAKMKGLPIAWDKSDIRVGARTFDAAAHVPAFVYPNPLNPQRYVVINSGITFREGHDRTNSLQNPKLPDWAVIDLSQDPTNEAPGKIAAAGFFDESWTLKPGK